MVLKGTLPFTMFCVTGCSETAFAADAASDIWLESVDQEIGISTLLSLVSMEFHE